MESPTLSLFSTEIRNAGENMATDLAMGEFLGPASPVALRFYGWSEPSISFGYFQKWDTVRKTLGKNLPNSVLRRPTGGGIVDHRYDLTFALSFRRGTAFSEQKTTCLYEAIHTLLSEALNLLGENTSPSQSAPFKQTSPSCFEAPVRSDIIDNKTGLKIAGSAIRRSKESILVQGSLDLKRLTIPPTTLQLSETFARLISTKIGLASIVHQPLSNLRVAKSDVEQFGHSHWTERR